ncbi:membrane protein [Microbacterium phage Nicole72]|uniref:Membrane protein n=1 Tax=Microbacterium phage Nicole72 TaxID=3062838 RepID=A0ACD4UJG4_9CAUD|nr:membrane protein [Microbacterium phage Nicole72]
MFSGLPPRERRAVQTALIAGWASATGAGISAAINPTSIVLTEMGGAVSVIMGAALALAAVVATVGIARQRYRMEWVAAWLAAAGFSPYVITIWSLTITANLHWLTAAFVATVALVFFVSRAVMCAAHAAKLRTLHEASETITQAMDAVADREGLGDDDSAR